MLWRRERDTTLCDQIWQYFAAGRGFSPVSSTNKADRHDMTDILVKVALNTKTLTLCLNLFHDV
jgi:hypothetical protein